MLGTAHWVLDWIESMIVITKSGSKQLYFDLRQVTVMWTDVVAQRPDLGLPRLGRTLRPVLLVK